MPEELQNMIRAGDVSVESVLIYPSTNANPFDLTFVWNSLSISESIGSDYVQATIGFADTQNLIETIPIIGNEKIIITYRTQGFDESRTFVGRITHIPARTSLNQGSQFVLLEAHDENFVINQRLKFSKSYKNALISDMVDDIFEEYIKSVEGSDITIVPTLERESKVIPFYSPMRAIAWLAKWARSPDYRSGVSYVFFKNRNSYYFGPLERLLDTDVNVNVAASYKQSTNILGGDTKNKDLHEGLGNILSYSIRSHDHLTMMSKGIMASTVITHDPILRTINKKKYNYFNSFDDFKHSNPHEITNETSLGEFSNSRVLLNPTQHQAFGDGVDSNRTQDVASIRMSQIEQIRGTSIQIVVPGDSNRTIGEIVRVDLPSFGKTTLNDTFGDSDKYVSGRYLIWSLKHEITRDGEGKIVYFTHMRLVKDGNTTELPVQSANPFGSQSTHSIL